MVYKKTLFFIVALLFLSAYSFAQELESSNRENKIISDSSVFSEKELKQPSNDSITPEEAVLFFSNLQKKDSIIYPPKKDYRKLGYNTLLYVGAAIAGFGVLYAMPESVTNWNKDEMKSNSVFGKWKQNVKAGPVWDNDKFVMNYIAHPYCGGIYYMTARSSGFNIWESFAYSAIMSTFFWEYGIEAFAEIPSKQDLIVTPVIGSMVGEGFFYAKKAIVSHDKKILNSKALGMTTLFLIDPFNTILDGCGYKDNRTTSMNITPVGYDMNSQKTVWGVNFFTRF